MSAGRIATAIPVASTPDAITADWLTRVLRQVGHDIEVATEVVGFHQHRHTSIASEVDVSRSEEHTSELQSR